MNGYFYFVRGDIIYKIGDYLVYKKDVCKVVEIKENGYNDLNYYILRPVYDKSLKIQIPITIKKDYIRDLISLEKLNEVVAQIPKVEVIIAEDKLIENEYKKLISTGDYLDLIKIIKTTYIRNKSREEKKKKISDKDKYYFNLAEKYLYNEFSIVLNKSIDETKEYIVKMVESLEK